MTMKTIGIYGLTHELLGHDWDYWLLTIVILWYLSGIHGDFAPVVYRVYLSYWGWLPRRSSNDCSRCAIAHNCTRISWHGHICLWLVYDLYGTGRTQAKRWCLISQLAVHSVQMDHSKSVDVSGDSCFSSVPVIGLRENLQETMVFTIKYGGFL